MILASIPGIIGSSSGKTAKRMISEKNKYKCEKTINILHTHTYICSLSSLSYLTHNKKKNDLIFISHHDVIHPI
jgi:hypothetical protein